MTETEIRFLDLSEKSKFIILKIAVNSISMMKRGQVPLMSYLKNCIGCFP